jgi:hypothetical protein
VTNRQKGAAAQSSFSSGADDPQDIAPFKGKVVFLHEKNDTSETIASWIAHRSIALADHPFADDLQSAVHLPLSILSDAVKQKQLKDAEQVILAIPESKVTEYARHLYCPAFCLPLRRSLCQRFLLAPRFP